ncbi:MAG: hypothetical protein K5637_01880 [Lachnospiraceae bacterium]|nr:hypothetical protein [Lachnospiraceae bacterium]
MDDVISRQAAIDAIERNAYRHTYLDQIIDIISDLPSAQPEPIKIELTPDELERLRKTMADAPIMVLPSAERKTGRWIVTPSPDTYHCGLVKCPYCQEELIAEPTEYHYCPNCGAEMSNP